jgi:hypothetical protein
MTTLKFFKHYSFETDCLERDIEGGSSFMFLLLVKF